MAEENGVVQTNPMNKPAARITHNYNTFDDTLSYRHALTARFGEYTPSFVMDGVPDDRIQVNSLDLLDSLSLKAPFKGSIRKIKESFKVPLMAILPRTWDFIYAQPSNGDDVPKDANCVLQNFPSEFKAFWFGTLTNLSNAAASLSSSSSVSLVSDWLSALMRTLVLGEYVYSNGSLLSVCGYHGSAQFRYKKLLPDATSEEALCGASYDKWMDSLLRFIFGRILEFSWIEPVGTSSNMYHSRGLSTTGESTHDTNTRKSSFRFFLEKMRENPNISISTFEVTNDTTLANLIGLINNLAGETGYGYLDLTNGFDFTLPVVPDDPDEMSDMSQANLNLSRILAYQLVCAHFYSNSSVDVIYSAELYRQYIRSLASSIATGSNPSPGFVFTRNGMTIQYDDLSENCLLRQLYKKRNDLTSLEIPSYALLSVPNNNWNARFATFAAIFGFRHSLRFGDYFVGARPRPLAPINTDVGVSSENKVSVIDITRGIQAQRFANAIMRVRQKIDEYVKANFKNAPAPDYHNPFFLAREAEIIYGDEVQNTGAAQTTNPNSRTSNFAANTGRYTFTFENEDAHPCVYLQIISFDVKRCYTRSVDRQFLHLDRFDMFNPSFQYIGDQPIYGIELGYHTTNSAHEHFFAPVFAYQSRDMEYKQRFDVASGGFVENLPGWILTDRYRDLLQPQQFGPDFIRSFNTELDQFYLSLTGLSLGSYYHFAIIVNNNISAKRPMAVDPQILE